MSIAHRFARSARNYSDLIAIETESETTTYGALEAHTNRLCRVLAAQPAPTSAQFRVGIYMSNSAMWVAAYLAIVKIGGTVVPLNTSQTRYELCAVIAEAKCRLLICDSVMRESAFELTIDLPSLTIVDVCGESAAEFSDGVVTPTGSAPVTAIPFTSGTTGSPKGVLVTESSTLASAHNALVAFGLGLQVRNLVTYPLSSHPVFVGHVLTPLLVGGTVVLRREFNPEDVADVILRNAVDFICHVPTALQRTLRVLGDQPVNPGITHMVGAAEVPRPLVETAITRLGNVVQGWGMTEATNIVTCSRRPPAGQPHLPSALNAGIPLPRSTVHIGHSDGSLLRLTPGLEGEAVVGGPTLSAGYLNGDSERFREQNTQYWTGDAVRVAENGALEIVGRMGDLIISGGYNVSPSEVEATLLAYAAPFECAVVGVPHDEWGQEVVAVISGVTQGKTALEQNLVLHCRERLSPHKRPKRYLFVENLPLTSSGKVRREALTQALIDSASSGMHGPLSSGPSNH